MELPSFEQCYEKSRDLLGHPLHEKQPTPDGIGLYQTFEQGSIHWHPDVGAHVTRGAIREAWRKCCELTEGPYMPRAKNTLSKYGYENGWLGYPTSEEYPFSILDLRKLNCSNGEENARLQGFLAIHEITHRAFVETEGHKNDQSFAQAQDFQNGMIYWKRAENRCHVLKKSDSYFANMPPNYREIKEPEPKGFFGRLFAW